VHLLIDAFKHLDTDIPLELLIYGDGLSDPGYYKSLRKFADLDPRIRFLGRYEYSQVANIFSDLGVLVIPSIWNEIGPWVMYEAFETRTPVIASDIPNMSHIIDHDNNGLLFECGNTHALKDQLQKVVNDPETRMKLIDGIKPVNTLENEMNSLFHIYQQII
jgi:glycosyltransferase involved in cell wall biosynthesis